MKLKDPQDKAGTLRASLCGEGQEGWGFLELHKQGQCEVLKARLLVGGEKSLRFARASVVKGIFSRDPDAS